MLVPAHPAIEDLLNGNGIEVIEPLPPLPPVHGEAAGFEHAQVLHHGESRKLREMAGELAGGARAVAQHVEHVPAESGWPAPATRARDPGFFGARPYVILVSHMTSINGTRVLLGGLVAGLVMNVGEAALHGGLLGADAQALFTRYQVGVPGSPVPIVSLILMTFVLGIASVWLSCGDPPALRPRRARTAIIAAWPSG